MSFDVFFQPCRYDGTTRSQLDPFTNQYRDYPYNAPLTPEELSCVKQAMKLAGAGALQADGSGFVQFDDGGNAEIYGADLGHGCMFAIRGAGVTPSVAQLLFDVLVAGNWVMFAAALANIVVVPPTDWQKGAPKEWGQVVVVISAHELFALLSGGFDAWGKYRDQVVKSRRLFSAAWRYSSKEFWTDETSTHQSKSTMLSGRSGSSRYHRRANRRTICGFTTKNAVNGSATTARIASWIMIGGRGATYPSEPWKMPPEITNAPRSTLRRKS